MSQSPTRFHVKSYGCQMNVYDGDRMAEMLGAQGMTPVADAAAADVVVLNTCHIREKAAEKVYSDIGSAEARRWFAPPTIAVAGCVAQAEGAEIKPAARPPSMSSLARRPITVLPDMLAAVARGRARHRPRHARRIQIRRFAAAPPVSAPARS